MFKRVCLVGYASWGKIFQFRILHRILATNKKLSLYGIKDSDKCDFCGLEPETILHLFCECDVSACIWEEVVNMCNQFGYNIKYLTHKQILFGYPSLDPIFNRMLLNTGNCKYSKNRVTIRELIAILKSQFTMEQYLARTNGNLKKFRGFWSSIWAEMQK